MEEKYNYYKELHPDWSHEQIMAAVSIDMSAAKNISEAGANVNPNDPDLIRSILQGAREWLREVLPEVFEKVAVFFEDLINNIGTWVVKGLGYVIDAIEHIYQKGKMIVDVLQTPVNK